jgi:hypothetical protein
MTYALAIYGDGKLAKIDFSGKFLDTAFGKEHQKGSTLRCVVCGESGHQVWEKS